MGEFTVMSRKHPSGYNYYLTKVQKNVSRIVFRCGLQLIFYQKLGDLSSCIQILVVLIYRRGRHWFSACSVWSAEQAKASVVTAAAVSGINT
jgi:hypothetical protein